MQIKQTYYEMSLYEKLRSMTLHEEHIAFIRYKAHQIVQNPSLRGDAVVPLIIATYIFEVLCDANVSSTVLKGPPIQCACKRSAEDKAIGYKCALSAIGKLIVISQ